MDHYQTLGVAKDATAEQIKAAYRRLARKYHPDVSREKDAQEKIKAINEAYAVLGDPDKRQSYDLMRSGRGAQGPAAEEFFGGGLNDLFDTLFNRSGRPNAYILELSLDQARRGGRQTLSINGSTVQVDIPAGVDENERIVAQDGATSFRVRYAPHASFQCEHGHVTGTLRLFPWDMALGGKQRVETLGGVVEATLPARLQPGQRIRLTGKGMPARPHRPAGDHWVQVEVEVPEAKTAAQRKAYEALRSSFMKEK